MIPRTIILIGIGAGDPEFVTLQAVAALNRIDVFFIPDKGQEKEDLNQLRLQICKRFIRGGTYRFVRFPDPRRDPNAPSYCASVETWHGERARIYARCFVEELAEGRTGGILAWGDPTLYDSTLRILDRIRAEEATIEYEVIPGISSVQVLAARHRIPLNRVGESVHITTGRKLSEKFPENAGSVVTVLDGTCAFKRHVERELDIYWGAYLGTPDEILISGRLRDVADHIESVRRQARRRKGWIMDTYLLRPSEPREHR